MSAFATCRCYHFLGLPDVDVFRIFGLHGRAQGRMSEASPNPSTWYRYMDSANTFSTSQSLTSNPEFIVVGAGLAGLAAASTLNQAGKEALVLEAGDAVGGRVRTDWDSGFTLDRGFQVLLTAYPELGRHINLSSLKLRPFVRGVAVWEGDRFIELIDPRISPLRLGAALRTSTLARGDRLRLVRLAVRLRMSSAGFVDRADDCSTGEFLRGWGFSERAMKSLWEPLFSGIQLTPALEGSARLACLILRCLILGPAAIPAQGMQAIPDQLASTLPAGSIRLESEVEAINGAHLLLRNGAKLSARKLIMATQGTVAAKLVGAEIGTTRAQWYAYFSTAEAPSRSSAIHLFPAGDGPCRNLAILSNVAPEYGSGSEALIVVAGPVASDEPPLMEARTQLRRNLGNQTQSWRLLKAGIVQEAQPGFAPNTPLVKTQDCHPEIVVAGDHRTTPSIQGALLSGRLAAQRAMANS